MKFLITGLPRSGTTLISSILNGQDDVCCLEIPLTKKIISINSNKDRIVTNYFLKNLAQIPIPYLEIDQNFLEKKEIYEKLESFYKEYFKVKNFGFKETFVNRENLEFLLKNNYKIIYVQRDSKKQFFSFVHSIQPDLMKASIHLNQYLKNLNLKTINNNNFYILNFDNFISNREKEIKNLEVFLGLKISENKKYYSFLKNMYEFKDNFTVNQKEKDVMEIKNYNFYLNYIYNNKYFLIFFLYRIFKKLF